MSGEVRNYLDFEELQEVDLNDPEVIDSVSIERKNMITGFIKFIVFTIIAAFIFFIPIEIGGSRTILFGAIYSGIIDLLGNLGLWLVSGVIIGNGVLSVYGKYFAPMGSKLSDYYESDSVFHPVLYLTGAAFVLLYSLDATTSFIGPDVIVGASTGGIVIPSIVLGVAWIIPVGAFFVPFLLDYGSIDFVGVLLEPIMRPIFKIPGKAAVDTIASFVGSSSMAIIITSRLYKASAYTKKEAAIIASSFSAVSVGYASLVITTAGLMDHFLKVYFSSMLLTFLVSFVMVRIPPLNKKETVFYNGRFQSDEELEKEGSYDRYMFSRGIKRASKKAYASGNVAIKVGDSLLDGAKVVPKVISLLCSIGIIGMILAKYTPVFDYIGLIFLPLMNLLQVPEAGEIAKAIPTGITEMFLPVLVIADQVGVLSEAARYFVVAVSMVQVIFFAETVVVMVSTGVPISIKELTICFFLRTFIAMPFVAIFMHIMF